MVVSPSTGTLTEAMPPGITWAAGTSEAAYLESARALVNSRDTPNRGPTRSPAPARAGAVLSHSTGISFPTPRGGPVCSDTGFAPSLSPGVHAREARALPSGRLEVGKGKPPLTGLEPALAHPSLSDRDPGISWPEVICRVCRSPIRRNELLGIRYCPVEPHGTSQDFLYWSRSHGAYVGV